MQSRAEKPTEYLIDLAADRIVSFRETDDAPVHSCRLRRITPEQWLRYLAAISAAASVAKGSRRILLDADQELVRSSLISVGGYLRSQAPEWEFIPASHLKAVSKVLQNIVAHRRSAADASRVEIELWAMWTITHPGAMGLSLGLIHQFSPPSSAQRTRYELAKSRYQSQQLLIELYDELVEGVEGYAVNGRPLDSVEDFRREMDSAHKIVAARELFEPSEPAGGDTTQARFVAKKAGRVLARG